MRPVLKSDGIISTNVMNSLLVDDSFFYNTEDWDSFLHKLKHAPEAIMCTMRPHMKESIERMAFVLGEPVTLHDEFAAARELVTALQNKYADKLAKIA